MNKLIKHILDNNLIVNCRTEEDAKELLKLAHESGLKWYDYESYIRNSCWRPKREETCYNLVEGHYSHYGYYKKNGYDIIEYRSLKNKLGIDNENKSNEETVLEVEFVDVFEGYKAWRIVKQDEEILKSDSVRVDILNQLDKFIPNNTSNNRHVRLEPKPFICVDIEESEIIEKVRLINEKYGRPKFDAEEEYKKLKEVEFVYGKENYFISTNEYNQYKVIFWELSKLLEIKYISKEDAEEFCRKANGGR